jgi:hypothetical protein
MSTAQAHIALQNRDAHSRRALSAWSPCDLMATPSTLQATLAGRSIKTITSVLAGTCRKGTTTAMPAAIILRR